MKTHIPNSSGYSAHTFKSDPLAVARYVQNNRLTAITIHPDTAGDFAICERAAGSGPDIAIMYAEKLHQAARLADDYSRLTGLPVA